MNSIPVLLSAMGGQVNVLGAGVQPSAAADPAAGSDAFLGLLQQLLLGGALQMPVTALATPQDTGTAGSESDGSGGETPPADGLTVMAVRASANDLMSAPPPGTAVQQTSTVNGSIVDLAQPLVAVQTETPVEGADTDAGAQSAASSATPAATPAVSGQAMDAILGMMEPVSGEQITAPQVTTTGTVTPTTVVPDPVATLTAVEAQEVVTAGVVPVTVDKEKQPQTAPVKPGKAPVDPKPVRRAGVLATAAELTSKVPVSPKEGDKTPVRAQATAPASMEEAVASEDIRRMVRVLQHVADQSVSTASDAGKTVVHVDRMTVTANVKDGEADASTVNPGREQEGTAVKAVPSSGHTAQDSLRDALQHREQTFTPPATPLAKVDSTRTADFSVRLPETLGTLPQETAKSVADQVIKGMALQVNGENSEVRIKLVPESLGEVTVHVKMESGKMQAQIDVSQVGVKSALEMQLPQIRQSLSERGIDVQRLDVSFGGDHPARESGGGQGDRRQRQGSKHAYVVDTVEQSDTGRLMGYNTMEMVM